MRFDTNIWFARSPIDQQMHFPGLSYTNRNNPRNAILQLKECTSDMILDTERKIVETSIWHSLIRIIFVFLYTVKIEKTQFLGVLQERETKKKPL